MGLKFTTAVANEVKKKRRSACNLGEGSAKGYVCLKFAFEKSLS